MSGEQGGASAGSVATFFDVDGTLVSSTIAHYYAYFRRARLSPLVGRLWFAGYLAKCGYYMLLDRLNRNLMNRVFYRSYRGLSADEIRGMSGKCYRDVIEPHLHREAPDCVRDHRAAGRKVVLVTGSIDFIIEPLADALDVDHVISAVLCEQGGRFTGELAGPPIGGEEKARRMEAFAGEHGIDLSASYGYGDSIFDLPMLEAVGHPTVVNPDGKLAAIAARRNWPVLSWTTEGGAK